MRTKLLRRHWSIPALCGALACSPTGESPVRAAAGLNSADGKISGMLTLQSHWGAGYCANVTVTNIGQSTISSWSAVINLGGATLANLWNARGSATGGQLSVINESHNGTLPVGTSTGFGFCANGSGTPSLVSVAATATATGGGGSGGTSGGGGSAGSGATGGSGGSGATGGSGSGGTSGAGATSGSGGTSGSSGGGGITSTCTEADRQVCSNGTGKHCGLTFEYWKDRGTGCLTNTADGFSVDWSNINNLLGRKGMRPGSKNQIVTYSADYRPNGNSYLCVYGWTRGPLVEYYIVDSWGSWRPPGGTSLGTVTSDGGTYDIYSTQRVNQPSIDGTATFNQYWSVRTAKRTSGTITVANHFNAWASKGMNLGSLYEVSMTVEGYQSSGTANVHVSMR